MTAFLIPSERIESRIFVFRGVKVMIDRDLAGLYGVETKALNQAVKRNRDRFPEDFMFQLTIEELRIWRSQFVTSNREKMGIRYAPLVFTEQGIAMLSSVLTSKRAVMVNIQIIRTFTKLREMLFESDSLRHKLELMEKQYDEQFKMVFDAIRRLFTAEDEPKTEIGFNTDD